MLDDKMLQLRQAIGDEMGEEIDLLSPCTLKPTGFSPSHNLSELCDMAGSVFVATWNNLCLDLHFTIF